MTELHLAGFKFQNTPYLLGTNPVTFGRKTGPFSEKRFCLSCLNPSPIGSCFDPPRQPSGKSVNQTIQVSQRDLHPTANPPATRNITAGRDPQKTTDLRSHSKRSHPSARTAIRHPPTHVTNAGVCPAALFHWCSEFENGEPGRAPRTSRQFPFPV